MRLPQPFYQIPILFDSERLQAEVAALPPEAWVPHPDGIPGNTAARLITVDGGDNDAHLGEMRPTRWLSALPYVQQILAGFGVVWSRSRLMRLAPGVDVPEHADINHHWHTRVRLHIPVFTEPAVRFHCDGDTVHMAAGEAWIFDNWRRHRVENGASRDRIHLVADTSGTGEFWRFACDEPPPRAQWRTIGWNPQFRPRVLTEADQRVPVMPAAELEWLIEDLRTDLSAPTAEAAARIEPFGQLLERFVRDWRQACALHGTQGRGLADFEGLLQRLRAAALPLGEDLVTYSNGAEALLVLEKRVLAYAIQPGCL